MILVAASIGMRNQSWWEGWKTSCVSLVLVLTGVAHAQTDGSQRWAFTTLSTATAGTIVSSPAVGPDGAVYVGVEVGSATSSSPSGRVFAINPNGSPKWAAPFT